MTTEGAAAKDDITKTLGVGGSSLSTHHIPRGLMWTAVVIVLIVVVFTVFGLSRGEDQVRYETQPVKRGDMTITVSATGTLQPTNTVAVGIEVSGTITSVDVDFNDHVSVGQVLARLDTSKLKAQVQQSEAALAAAKAKVLQTQASVREAKADLERLQGLRKTNPGLVSQQSLDAAQASYDRARADVASTQATVQQASGTLEVNRTDLSKAVIHSPISGVVLNRSVEPGQTVAASFQAPTLFELAEDLSHMELQADIDEADVGKVHEGQQASFTVDAYPDRPFPAHITQLRYGSETVDGVVTYKAILAVNNPDLVLRPGMTATAQIVVQHVKNALLVPNAALRFSPPTQSQQQESSGGLLGKMFPRPPQSMTSESAPSSTHEKKVWILRNKAPAAVSITTGVTDGTDTVVTGGDLPVDTPVLTDVVGGN